MNPAATISSQKSRRQSRLRPRRICTAAVLFQAFALLGLSTDTSALAVRPSASPLSRASSSRASPLFYFRPDQDSPNGSGNTYYNSKNGGFPVSATNSSPDASPSQPQWGASSLTPNGSSSNTNSRTNELMEAEKRKNEAIAQQWEAEIKASTDKKSDLQKVSNWAAPAQSAKPHASGNGWKVALSGACVLGGACEWLSGNPTLSVTVLAAVFFAALRDPLQEDEDALAGPVTRLIGRSALDSYEKTQPKIKAVARAAVGKEEDAAALKAELVALREENARLREYFERREWIDEHQSDYHLDDLRTLAQQRYQMPGVSRMTKPQLMMRLLQVGAIRM